MDNTTLIKEKQINDLIDLNDELENYFTNTIISQLFVDVNFILRKFTPPAMKQFNLSNSDLGKPISDAVHNIRSFSIIDDISAVIESQRGLEKEIQTTDFRWYQMNILPYILKKEKRPNGVIITFVDITDRIETLGAIEKLNLKYENAFYSISHDLKGPLSNIEGLVRELKEPALNVTDIQDLVNVLDLSVDNLRKFIEELTFEINNNDSVMFPQQKGNVNFEDILQDVQLALKSRIVDTEAKITTEFKEPNIKFSKSSIRSIIYNIVSNALKYKAKNRSPEILIKSERVKDALFLSIRDNGRGIAEEEQEKIFHRNYRLCNDIEGTGVGLFIVKKMVEESGGRITVESSPQGSTFNIYFMD